MITCTALVIGMHIGTYHFDRKANFNEANPGIYANCDNIVAGVYYNSLRKASGYAGYTFHLGPVDVMVGAATGYENQHGNGPLAPMIIPSVKLGQHVRVNLIPLTVKRGGGVHLSYDF